MPTRLSHSHPDVHAATPRYTMKHIISIRNLGKKYRLGLVHEDFLTERVFKSVKELFSRNTSQRKEKNNGPEELWALKDVSFDVKPGEVVGIIGRNGAGKSTLLKILSSITEPTEGEIRLRGRVASLLEVGAGFHPELTGRENVYLNGAIMGMRKYEIGKKFDEIVGFAEVEKFIDTPVKRYSSGMYVRLAFAVAAHLEPDILLVDEVLAVGDAAFQKKCLGKMNDVAGEGRTVLFVSHQMGVLGKLCETAIQLEAGQIVNSGETSEVIGKYLKGINVSEEAVYSYSEDESKIMQMREVRILNHKNEPVQMLSRDKPFRVEITFQVRQRVTNSYVVFILSTMDNVTRICISRNIDNMPNEWGEYEPGIYCTTVEFPGGILNAGHYYARLGLFKSQSLTKKDVFDEGKSPSFELIDTGTGGFQTSLAPQKRGLLALDLEWTQEKVE